MFEKQNSGLFFPYCIMTDLNWFYNSKINIFGVHKKISSSGTLGVSYVKGAKGMWIAMI